jgi:hypothetical protein
MWILPFAGKEHHFHDSKGLEMISNITTVVTVNQHALVLAHTVYQLTQDRSRQRQ